MQQAGRKSAASLATVTPLPSRGVAPPEDLSADARAEWVRIVASKPADWFDVGSAPLLAQYCNVAVQARAIAAKVNDALARATETEWRFKRYEKLCALQKTLTLQLKSLAASLRLSQQARYDAKEAATAARGGVSGNKPWQMDFTKEL